METQCDQEGPDAPKPDVWPEWLLEASTDMPASLNGIDMVCRRLRATAQTDYGYRHVLQDAITAVTDRLVSQGIIDPKTGKVTGSANLSSATETAFIYQMGSAYRLLGLICFAKQATLVHLLEAARAAAASCNLIGTLTSCRSVIEHIAHFDAIINKLQPYAVPAGFDEANNTLVTINGTLVKMGYATRYDLKALVIGDAEELLRKNKAKYKPKPNRQDRTADTVLDAIDGLTKKIKGTRGVYEAFCEFAHPNVGALLGLTKSAAPYKDEHGVLWIRKQITLGAPVAVVQEMGDVLSCAFRVLAQCLSHFEGLLAEADKQRSKLQQMMQVVFREVLPHARDLLSPYESCPCESGRKVKFCCGQTWK